MKRFKYFFVFFSVLALLLSFSAVDVKAGTPGVSSCAIGCLNDCQPDYFSCFASCRGPGAPTCEAQCAIDRDDCFLDCFCDDCYVCEAEPAFD